MTEAEIIAFANSLKGVTSMTADEASGAPQIAWGDTFFFVGSKRRHPFATIVTKDYEDFDEFSDLNRPGVFRLNVFVGREGFEELLGYAPVAHVRHVDEIDYTALDVLLPHPVYATQSWVSIVNPSGQARDLLKRGYERARG
jgi:hypothetical protein